MVSIVHAVRDIGRLRDITRVLMRHGFGEVVARLGLVRKGDSQLPSNTEGGDPASVRLRRVLEDLGPSFVKLGQIVSTRSDLLPEELILELRKLQDSVSPVPFSKLRDRTESSLGASLESLFASVDERPLAAASVAQVHRAILVVDEEPQEVVIKVQRPGIAETIACDLDILHSLAALLERTIAETRVYSPVALVQQFDRAIRNELDFTAEADNAERFTRNFAGRPRVLFPKVYRSVSSKHVVCLEYLDGLKINEAVKQGFSGPQLATMAIELVVKQIFEDGFFHADPHPGNVLILGTPAAPIYALIDLGMVGRLSPKMRDLTVDMMVAALRRDYDAVADALYSLATPKQKIDHRAFRAEIAELADRYLGRRLKDIQVSGLIRDLVGAANRYGLEVPPDFLLVGKALMTIEGIGKEIAPELDILEESRPFFLELLKKRYSPERLGTDLLRRLDRLGTMTNNMPEQLQEVLDDLRLGRLTVRANQTELLQASQILSRRLYAAVVVGALILTAGVLAVGRLETPALVVASLALLAFVFHNFREGLRSIGKRS